MTRHPCCPESLVGGAGSGSRRTEPTTCVLGVGGANSSSMALRRDAKVELLRKVPLFDRVSQRELARIAGLAVEVSYPSGVPLLRQGSRDDGFFILLNGEVDVRQGARLVQTLKRGKFFGEIGLLANVTRTATVTSGTPVDVLRIAGRDFRNLLRSSPALSLAVLEELAYRLQTTALAG